MKKHQKSAITKLSLTTIFVLFLTSCASMGNIVGVAVDTGKAIVSASEDFTSEQEYYIGRSIAASILSQYSVYENKEAKQYLNEICQTLVINSNMPELYKGYYVQILDSSEINAFATSGGHILITRGLLQCAQSEDALAAVIAHEIAHIQLEHGISAIKTSRKTAATTKTIGAIASITAFALEKEELAKDLQDFNQDIGELTQVLVNTGYSQKQEFEADTEALYLLANAGYSPSAMTNMLELLEQHSKGQKQGFTNTHPKPELRLENVHKELLVFGDIQIKKERTARFEQFKQYL